MTANAMKTVPLSAPLAFGKTEISEISLRTPTAGDLRGIKLQDIVDLDVNTILTVTKRLSVTEFAPATLNGLAMPDLASLAGAIADFFNPAGVATPAGATVPAGASYPTTP